LSLFSLKFHIAIEPCLNNCCAGVHIRYPHAVCTCTIGALIMHPF